MKLASYRDGSRDGHLVVVSRDLKTAHYASGIASRLPAVLDDWNFLAPQLQDLYDLLNQGRARHAFPFEPLQCMAPLPRAYGWQHVDTGATTPRTQRGSRVLGAHEDWNSGLPAGGGQARALWAALAGDLAAGQDPGQALDSLRLLALAVALAAQDATAPEEQVLHGLAFAPVAITPDELGAAWPGGELGLTLELARPGAAKTRVDAGYELGRRLGHGLAGAVATYPLPTGHWVTGPMDVRADAPADAPERSLHVDIPPEGVTLKLQVLDAHGHSLFGALVQAPPSPTTPQAESDPTRHDTQQDTPHDRSPNTTSDTPDDTRGGPSGAHPLAASLPDAAGEGLITDRE